MLSWIEDKSGLKCAVANEHRKVTRHLAVGSVSLKYPWIGQMKASFVKTFLKTTEYVGNTIMNSVPTDKSQTR